MNHEKCGASAHSGNILEWLLKNLADIHQTVETIGESEVLGDVDIDWSFAENVFLKVTQGTRTMAMPLTSVLKVQNRV
ncbi:MAG: hypothetical protein ACYCPP_05220 [Nitrososphaerales archaeon]